MLIAITIVLLLVLDAYDYEVHFLGFIWSQLPKRKGEERVVFCTIVVTLVALASHFTEFSQFPEVFRGKKSRE